MSELLPVIFQKGMNESIDSRLAPPEVHALAQNVRWRKDGRPAKRYGSVAISTAEFAASGFNTQPVNLVSSWNGVPILAIGSSVRQRSALGWDAQAAPDAGELSHWGPGERDIIARDENILMSNLTAGTCKGMTLYVWDSGTNLYYSVKGADGATVVTPRFLFAGTFARCISTANYIYVLSKNGTTLDLRVFDPTTLVVTAGGSPGTLDASGSYFDACGRGSDFLVTYQSAAGTATTKSFSAILVPVNTATITTAVAVTLSKLGVVGDATSNVFVAVNEPSAGQVKVQAFTNSLSGSLGVVIVDTDINNDAMPGLVLENTTTAQVVWGGYVAATATSYMRAAELNASGVIGTVGTFYGVAPASKPFMGPAYGTIGAVDGAYVWVATHNNNSGAGSAKWDTQAGYVLVKFRTNNTTPLRRQLHVPNVFPSAFIQNHLLDVLNLGSGYGYVTPLLNAVRFGNLQNPTFGADSVSIRSIFESMRTAARDSVNAGRALQISGGSLFEFNGSAEETGFSSYPVIQSVTGGGGGSLSGASNYLYRAVFEWIDGQGRRHRSAPSDPIVFATGANSSATLVIKPIIADAHLVAASGSITGRGIKLHVYRTLAGQGTYHRVTPNTGAPSGSVVGAATVSYTDIMSDATAAVQEFIYTDGGVAENTLAPPSTFMTVCNGRVWLGGQLERNVITASKILVEGEPTQYSDLDAFSAFLPEKCTGLASIDGTVVAFAREKIYFITGDGPNDQGVGSFNPPVELPTDVGCIDWRSVVETSLGVFFQSKRGIYLLPRGFNTPVFIGFEVESTLAGFPIIVSSVSVVQQASGFANLGEITARFVVASSEDAATSRVLTYDLRSGGWSLDRRTTATGQFAMSGSFLDTFIYTTTSGGSGGAFLALRAEAPGIYDDGPDGGSNPTPIPSTLTTGDIRPFGIAGYGGFDRVVVMGEYRGSSSVSVRVSVDGANADVFSFAVSSGDAPDNTVYLDVTPKTRLGTAIQVTVVDIVDSTTEGFIVQGLFIEHDTIGKTKRLAEARKK